MKRTVIKRRKPLRAQFRSWDERELDRIRKEERMFYRLKTGANLAHDPERSVMYIDVDSSSGFTVSPPVGRVPRAALTNARRNKPKKTKYARRERAWDFMEWVKAQPCLLALTGRCWGVVEADHAGDRGLGQKSLDRDCIPLCTGHHKERTDASGFFKSYTADRMREWRHDAVRVVHDHAQRCGVVIPEC